MIDLTFTDIYITISPQMVNIVLVILSAMGSTSKVNSNEISQETTSEELMKIKPINKKSWYLNCTPSAKEALDLIDPNISENNQLIFNMNSIKVLFKSSGSSNPLIKFSIFLLGKMANKNLHFDVSLVADYYNLSLKTWEPLIEPVNEEPLSIKCFVNFEENCTKIIVEFLQNMEILLTKSSINLLYGLKDAFSSALSYSKPVDKDRVEDLVTIRNYLGIDLAILRTSNIYLPNENSNKQLIKKDGILKLIKSGKSCHFIAKDISKVELFVHLLFSDKLIVERQIVCQNSSVRFVFKCL